jgi:hypothetical protein
MLNCPVLFVVLALTVVAAATATGPHPTAASDSTLPLHRRALAVTAGADACTGDSTGLPATECSAWLDLYDGTGGTASGVQNVLLSV